MRGVVEVAGPGLFAFLVFDQWTRGQSHCKNNFKRYLLFVVREYLPWPAASCTRHKPGTTTLHSRIACIGAVCPGLGFFCDGEFQTRGKRLSVRRWWWEVLKIVRNITGERLPRNYARLKVVESREVYEDLFIGLGFWRIRCWSSFRVLGVCKPRSWEVNRDWGVCIMIIIFSTQRRRIFDRKGNEKITTLIVSTIFGYFGTSISNNSLPSSGCRSQAGVADAVTRDLSHQLACRPGETLL